MTIDVGLRLAGERDASRKGWGAAPWLAGAVVFVAAILLRQVLPFNVDVSWWLTVSERMLDGQRLYVDILETNPPMAGLVYWLGVVIARALGLRAEVVTDGLIFLLIAASLTMTWHILRYSSLHGRLASGALAAWTAVLLGILPMYDFGQREHLALVAILPALAVYILRGNRDRVTTTAVLIAGLSAAITMNFKPYFAVAVGFCILGAAAQARDWRVVFAPENWIAAALVGLYVVCIFIFYPEYFTVIYPLVRDVYLLLKVPLLALFVTSAMALWVIAVIVVLVLQNRQPKPDAAAFVVLAASSGFAIAFFIQGKGWGYHAYPMVALVLLAAGFAISAIDSQQVRSKRLRFAAMLAVTAIFAKACIWFNASVDVRQIEDQIARLGPHPRILMLSAAAVIGHPMVRTLEGTWVSRQEAFWVREIIRRSRMDGTIDSQAAARLEGYVARERAGLIEDFRRQPPDVVLIDNQDSDFGSWAHADLELSALLSSYTVVRTIKGIDILRRTNGARS
ncbi:MAG TPA: hypothetical protein VKT76_14090 [Bradyrhizobium sp.]|nr:hypothetical protein [Bradyrhizobium sp.]